MGERPGTGDHTSPPNAPALPLVVPATDQPRSRTGRQLAKAAHAAGWTVHVTPGRGTTPVLDPDRPQCPQCMSRHKVYIDTPVESEAIRLRHPDGRAAVAVLISRDGRSWAGDDAWTWGSRYQLTETTPGQLLKWLQAETDQEASAA